MSFRSLWQILQKSACAILDILSPPSPLERRVRSMTADDLALYIGPPVENTVSLFDYRDETIKHMIWLLKYKKNRHVADIFAAILHDHLAEEVEERALFGISSPPLLVPIPLSRKRRRERGYNQTELLAEALIKQAGTGWYNYAPDILLKTKETSPQTSLSNKTERERNLRGVFRVDERAVEKHALKNSTVILLDDVSTTGMTFSEARRALWRGGAKEVITIALAH